MLCALTKWLISRREDTGRRLPLWAEGHLRRCPSCREFAGLVSSWEKQRSDLRVFDQGEMARGRRIRFRPPAGESPRLHPAFARHRVPAAALAMVFAAIVLGAIWLAWPRTQALPSLDELINSERVNALRGEIATVESPLRQEMEGLERTLGAAVDFLVSRLDPGLGSTKEKNPS
jgi:hypothetical protein